MTPDTFLEHFATFAAAPNGVAKLRVLILQLAVQGQIVPQDENDEPVGELRDQLAKQSAELEVKGRTTRPKPLASVEESEMPFDAPSGWEWVRFGELAAEVEYGTSQKASTIGGSVPVLRMNAIRDGQVLLTDLKFVEPTIDDLPRLYLKDGDILFNRTNSFELVGKTGVFKGPDDKFTFASYLIRASLLRGASPDFVSLAMNSNYFRKTQIEPEVTQQCGQANFNGTKLRNALIPLPPLAEQRRIVGKVDQLLGLCDELASRQESRRAARERLVVATLDRLTSPWGRLPACPEMSQARQAGSLPYEAESAAHAQRLQDHFDLLFDTPTTIPHLRQAILQLAVQGQLVPQDPNDEPADIATAPPQIDDDAEASEFEIPTSWSWTHLRDTSLDLKYGTSARCDYGGVGVPVLRIPNVVAGKIDLEDMKYGPLNEKEQRDLRLQEGDLLLIRSNGSTGIVGRTAVVDQNAVGFAYAGYLVRLRFPKTTWFPEFLHLAMSAKFCRDQIEGPIRTTSGVKNINSTEIGRLLLLVPPLAEQKRIVSKVTELLSLCDALESQLQSTESASTQLLSAAVSHLLSQDS